jgi:hypothetical protein
MALKEQVECTCHRQRAKDEKQSELHGFRRVLWQSRRPLQAALSTRRKSVRIS